MSTTVVWVLVMWWSWGNGYGYAGGPMVIDDIASQQNCRALARVLQSAHPDTAHKATCIAVRKVRP